MPLRFPSALLACACGVAVAHGAPAEAPSRLFEGRDLFALQCAADPQIRPDGRVVAYVRISFDLMTDRPRSAVWLVDVESGTQTPLAAGQGDQRSPRFSPDGARLAYVSTTEGGRSELFVRWTGSGVSARIADLAEAPDDLAWSPDGTKVAFTMFVPDAKPELGKAPQKPEGATWAPPLEIITDIVYRTDAAGYLRPGYTHAFVVPADGGSPRQLTFGAFNETGPLSFSPDGRFLLVTGNRSEGWRREPVNTEIYEVALADLAVKQLTHRAGPDRSPAVSPDGSRVAFLSYEDRLLSYQNLELHVMDRDGGHARSLTHGLDRTIDAAAWADGGKSILVQYTDRAVTKVARVTLDGRVEPIVSGLAGAEFDRPYTGGEFSVAADGTVAFTSGAADSPSDVSVTKAGRTRRLTKLSAGLLADKTLGTVAPLAVTSSYDERAVDAWVVSPPNVDRSRKYPLVLEIHGGPYASYGPVFSTDDQLYAAAGYVVLFVNPRGSTSYGEEFADLIHHDYPGHDYEDLMSAVDAAIALGFVDPDNLFVTGGSGGGILTAWITAKTTRFRAAAAQKPVINWTSLVLTTDEYLYMPKYWFSSPPWEDPEPYWRHSPLSLVGSVTTPTLVVVGDRDYRTPVSDSEQYYAALQLRGVPTALVKVPGASHGHLTARPSQSAARASAILAWFERYRKKAD